MHAERVTEHHERDVGQLGGYTPSPVFQVKVFERKTLSLDFHVKVAGRIERQESAGPVPGTATGSLCMY